MGNADELRYSINEIFLAPQGEGSKLGVIANFIRFSGCNLQCPWCDTKHEEGHYMTRIAIMQQLSSEFKTVIITGGEPLLCGDEAIRALVYALHLDDYSVYLETNGTIEVPDIFEWVAVSPKRESNWLCRNEKLSRLGELKLVVDEALQLHEAEAIARMAWYKNWRLWLQPQAGWDGSFNKCFSLLRDLQKAVPDLSNIRIGVQAHKLWGCR